MASSSKQRRSRKPRPRPYAREPRPITAQPTTDSTAQALGVGYRRKAWIYEQSR